MKPKFDLDAEQLALMSPEQREMFARLKADSQRLAETMLEAARVFPNVNLGFDYWGYEICKTIVEGIGEAFVAEEV